MSNKSESILDQDQGPATGVFIFSKKIKNDGRIISSGSMPVTHIDTEEYSGRGTVESHQFKFRKTKWYKSWWMLYLVYPLLVFLMGTYLVFVFG